MTTKESSSSNERQGDNDRLNPHTDRSSFLKGTALAGLIGGIELLYPGAGGAMSRVGRRAAPRLAATQAATIGPDPGFARGEVTAMTESGVLVENELRSRAIIWPANMMVWKEVFIPADRVAVGDTLSVRGTPQSDGSLLARPQWAWVNIGVRSGEITSLSSSQVVVRGPNGGVSTLDLSPALEVVDVNTGITVTDKLARVSTGVQIGAVGLVGEDDTFRATRIWFDAA